MSTLFNFSLELLASALRGRASLDDTRLLSSQWRTLFPNQALQEQQLDRSEFAVYLTAVARDSRGRFGARWSTPEALTKVRQAFLDATSPMSPTAAMNRALGNRAADGGVLAVGAKRGSRKRPRATRRAAGGARRGARSRRTR